MAKQRDQSTLGRRMNYGRSLPVAALVLEQRDVEGEQ